MRAGRSSQAGFRGQVFAVRSLRSGLRGQVFAVRSSRSGFRGQVFAGVAVRERRRKACGIAGRADLCGLLPVFGLLRISGCSAFQASSHFGPLSASVRRRIRAIRARSRKCTALLCPTWRLCAPGHIYGECRSIPIRFVCPCAGRTKACRGTLAGACPERMRKAAYGASGVTPGKENISCTARAGTGARRS